MSVHFWCTKPCAMKGFKIRSLSRSPRWRINLSGITQKTRFQAVQLEMVWTPIIILWQWPSLLPSRSLCVAVWQEGQGGKERMHVLGPRSLCDLQAEDPCPVTALHLWSSWSARGLSCLHEKWGQHHTDNSNTNACVRWCLREMNEILADHDVLQKGCYKHNVNGGGVDGNNSNESEDNWVRNSMTDDGWVRGFWTCPVG